MLKSKEGVNGWNDRSDFAVASRLLFWALTGRKSSGENRALNIRETFTEKHLRRLRGQHLQPCWPRIPQPHWLSGLFFSTASLPNHLLHFSLSLSLFSASLSSPYSFLPCSGSKINDLSFVCHFLFSFLHHCIFYHITNNKTHRRTFKMIDLSSSHCPCSPCCGLKWALYSCLGTICTRAAQ